MASKFAVLGKKGIISFNVIAKIMDFIFLIIVIFTIGFLINLFYVTSVDIKPVEMQLFASRIVYSPNSISYTDQLTQRLYPGVIDLERFSTANLEKSLSFDKKYIFAKITLLDMDGKKIREPIYYEKEGYERYYPLAETKALGPAGAVLRNIRRYVLIRNTATGAMTPAILNLEVVSPS